METFIEVVDFGRQLLAREVRDTAALLHDVECTALQMNSQWFLKRGRKQADVQVGELFQLLQVGKSLCHLHG